MVDDVLLHPAQAGERHGVQCVFGTEPVAGPGQQVEDVVAGRVDEAEHPAAAPVAVVGGQLVHAGEHLGRVRPVGGQAVGGGVGHAPSLRRAPGTGRPGGRTGARGTGGIR